MIFEFFSLLNNIIYTKYIYHTALRHIGHVAFIFTHPLMQV